MFNLTMSRSVHGQIRIQTVRKKCVLKNHIENCPFFYMFNRVLLIS